MHNTIYFDGSLSGEQDRIVQDLLQGVKAISVKVYLPNGDLRHIDINMQTGEVKTQDSSRFSRTRDENYI